MKASCPKCKSKSNHRMRRSAFVKLIPGTKTYACDKCNTEYTWFSFLNRSFKV